MLADNRNQNVFSFCVFNKDKKKKILTGIEGITTCSRRKKEATVQTTKGQRCLDKQS